MNKVSQEWIASAAYLYLLHLPNGLLAWEYLRRNVEYQRQSRLHATDRGRASQWGLSFFRRRRPRCAPS